MNSNEMKGVREQFFEGEGPTPLVPMSRSSVSNRSSKEAHTANDMLNRIDPRLRRLVVRACRNSYAASKVAGYFEDFVLRSFATTTASKKTKNVGSENWWRDIVLECPTVTQRKDNGRYSAHFFFHATAPTGGFHRLLLQAVCQFHGLHAVSRMEDNFLQQGKESCGARVLVVSGAIIASPVSSFRLLALLDADTSTIINPKEKEIERSMHHRSSIECSQQTSHEHDLEYVIVEKP